MLLKRGKAAIEPLLYTLLVKLFFKLLKYNQMADMLLVYDSYNTPYRINKKI